MQKVVIEGVEFDEDEECVVVAVRPRKATKRRCGECGRRCPGYDRHEDSDDALDQPQRASVGGGSGRA